MQRSQEVKRPQKPNDGQLWQIMPSWRKRSQVLGRQKERVDFVLLRLWTRRAMSCHRPLNTQDWTGLACTICTTQLSNLNKIKSTARLSLRYSYKSYQQKCTRAWELVSEWGLGGFLATVTQGAWSDKVQGPCKLR
jgi:hypothetical protein